MFDPEGTLVGVTLGVTPWEMPVAAVGFGTLLLKLGVAPLPPASIAQIWPTMVMASGKDFQHL